MDSLKDGERSSHSADLPGLGWKFFCDQRIHSLVGMCCYKVKVIKLSKTA